MKNITINKIIKKHLGVSKEFKIKLDKLRKQVFTKEQIDEEILLKKFFEYLEKYPANPLVLDLFADFLLVMDNDKIIDTYELSDVQDILENKIFLQKMNISYHEDILYFFWNVLNEKEKATIEIDFIIDVCKKKINELVELRIEIENY